MMKLRRVNRRWGQLVVALALILRPPSMAAAGEPTLDQMVGLWGGEQAFGPFVKGQLTIDARGPQWRASIAGYDVEVSHNDRREVWFSLPDDIAKFRGHLAADSRAIEGHWIQAKLGLPGCCQFPYASPVTLKLLRKRVWKGEARPLAYTLTVYLDIQRNADGSYGAFIRNPEANVGMHRPLAALISGSELTLTNTAQSADVLHATYDSASDQISLTLPQYHTVLRLARRHPDDAPGFSPRTPSEQAYIYRQPIKEDDGWPTASMADVGLKADPIIQLMNGILRTETRKWTTPYIQSLLIARHGKLVVEEYFNGFDQDRPHDIRSAGKSLTAALLGVAIYHGARVTPSTPIYKIFPEYLPFANPDPRKQQITVENLLTMTTGLACDDDDPTSPGTEDAILESRTEPDWYKATLDLPMIAAPEQNAGSAHSVYCTEGMNLVGGVIHSATHMWMPDFFDRYFAKPLDIHEYYLDLMPNGDYYGGGGDYFRPRDWIKIGQLYLNGGSWNGKRILGKDWVKISTRQYGTMYDAHYWATHPTPPADRSEERGYGYGWHLFALRSGGQTYRAYEAQGNGGQIVAVIPSLDLVIGFTGGNYQNGAVWNRFSSELIPQYVIPAAVAR